MLGVDGRSVSWPRWYHANDGARPARSPAEDFVAPAAKRPWRVAVVEDDPALSSVLVAMVEAVGYEAFEVDHGSDVELELRRCQADAVILDHGMQPRSGLDIVTTLRSEGSPVRVCMLSGNVGVESDALEAGADRFLLKPVKLGALALTLEELRTT